MLANRTMGGGLPAPSFWLELADAGAGAVNTTPSFANGSPTATFTRATTAWTKLSSGLWASVASGTARSCYLGQNTAVGAYGGYLAEGAATQLVTPTASIRGMDDASWVKANTTGVKSSTGIDGVASSCTRVTATGANGTILQTLVAAATTRTYSCFIKRITGTGEIDISEDGTTWTDITSQINSTTFTRVSITVSQLNAAFGLRLVTSGDAIDVDFNQFESGSFATSPLDAAGAVRNADVLTYASAGNIGSTACTMYLEAAPVAALATGTNRLALSIDDTTANERYNLFSLTTTPTSLASRDVTGGANTNPGDIVSVFTAGVVAKIAMSVAVGSAQVVSAGNGTLSTKANPGALPVVTTIHVGSDNASINQFFGTIKNLRLFATKLADNQMVSLTQ